jgi:hypothetical protein
LVAPVFSPHYCRGRLESVEAAGDTSGNIGFEIADELRIDLTKPALAFNRPDV